MGPTNDAPTTRWPDAYPAATIVSVIDWPVPAFNVESVAVAKVGDDLLFLYAERASGQPTTAIQWAPLTLDPISLGAVTAVEFTSPTVKGPDDRPISAMEVGAEGPIYVASAYAVSYTHLRAHETRR